ncbi:MAG: Holliday junction resolvase [Candidatus Methanofastidiosum sp.]|nr:Holliday junction resolvase [Methanofastidiosum sp.]
MSYNRGRNSEVSLVKKLWENGYAALRMPGSGRGQLYPHPDIIAGNGKKYLGIEVKIRAENRCYFKEEDVEKLKVFCNTFGADPYFAVRFVRRWRFFRFQDLEKTPTGYRASFEKGQEFSNVIGEENDR